MISIAFVAALFLLYALTPDQPRIRKKQQRKVATHMKFYHKPGLHRKPPIKADVEVLNN